MPWLWLIAGPNGSGKTTIARRFAELWSSPDELDPDHINPDAIRRELAAADPGAAATVLDKAAAEIADQRFVGTIATGRSLIRETVLSTLRLKPHCEAAIASGYRFGLLYVFLRSADLNVGRVAARAASGGHDVPEQKVRSRYERSLALLPSYAALASTVLMFDNSRIGEPELILERSDTRLHIAPNVPGRYSGNDALQTALAQVIAQSANTA